MVPRYRAVWITPNLAWARALVSVLMGLRTITFATSMLAVFALTACMPGSPVVTPEPDAGATPAFASDEEALAAATEAYGRYRDVADEIFHDGGANADRLATVATGEHLKLNLGGFREVAEKGLRGSGRVTFDQVTLQQYDQLSEGSEILVVYLCEDFSGTDVLNADGVSVVAADRPNRVRLQVTFDYQRAGNLLLVSDSDVWANEC